MIPDDAPRSATERAARRRYAALTGLHWLSVGLVLPVEVLLLQARGISLATVGVLFAAFTGAVAVLELPTGGLADTWGRRPVLATAATFAIAGNVVLAVGSRLPALAVGMLLLAAARSLSSGTLEAWYVDVARGEDPGADLTVGLARGGTAEGLALAVGAIVGGFLPGFAGGLPSSGNDAVLSFSLPLLVAAGVSAVELIVVVAAVGRRVGRAAGTAPRVVSTLLGGVRLAARSPTVRRLLLRFAGVGFAVAGLELIVPSRLADLLDDTEDATRVYAVLATVAFAATAAGAATAPAVRRRLGTPARGAFAATLCAGLVALMIGIPLLAALVVGFVGSRLLAAPARPLVGELFHDEVDADRRATLLSAQSVAVMAGSLAGSLCLPAVAEAVGEGWGLTLAGCVLAASALPLVGLGTRGVGGEGSPAVAR